MKKITAIIISLCVIFLTAACSAVSDLGIPEIPEVSETVSEQPDTDIDIIDTDENVLMETVSSDYTGTVNVTVSICNTAPEIEYDPNPEDEDNIILMYLAEKPVVGIEGNAEATQKINDYFYLLDEAYRYGEMYEYGFDGIKFPGKAGLLEAATDNYSRYFYSQADVNLEFSFSHMVDVKRCDSSVISFLFTDYLYMGSGAGEYYKYAVSFDALTGELLKLGDICSPDELKNVVTENIPVSFDSSETASFKNGLDSLLGSASWYLSGDSFILLYNKTAAYVGNSVEFIELCCSDYPELIDRNSFIKFNKTTGTIDLTPIENNSSEKEIIDSVVFSEEGNSYYLEVSGTVSNIRVYEVQYSDADGKFYTKSLLWGGSYMNDSILQIKTVIPEGMPNLMICFESDGTELCKLLSANGVNGTPVLVDNNISAVG